MSIQPSVPSLPSARYSHSFERGLAMLKAFTPGQPVLGIADLADQLGMRRSTTHRYAITLVALSYLEQSASRKYRLAARASDLGIVALKSTRSYERALPVLEDLRKQTGYTASLAVLDGMEIVYVQRVRSRLKGQAEGALAERLGSRLPAHATAAGKALLAYLPKDDLHALVRESTLTQFTATTIVLPDGLLVELQRVHTERCAFSDGELRAGVCAVAVPIGDPEDGVLAAVDITAYADVQCALSQLEDFVPVLRAAADCLAGVLRSEQKAQD